MTYKAKMRLGPYDFEWNPTQYTIPEEGKSYSVVQTYESVAFFSWSTTIVGKEILLEWDRMKEAQWDELQTLLETDQQQLWTPISGESVAYNVEMCQLDGRFMDFALHDAPYRDGVKLLMVVINEV